MKQSGRIIITCHDGSYQELHFATRWLAEVWLFLLPHRQLDGELLHVARARLVEGVGLN